MTYDYVTTKPELNEDTLQHYGVKGMKWRHRKARIKGKTLEARAKINRKLRGIKDNEISWYNGKTSSGRTDSGKALSTSGVIKGNATYNGKRETQNDGYSKKALTSGAYKDKSPGYTRDSNYGQYYDVNGKYYHKKKRKEV